MDVEDKIKLFRHELGYIHDEKIRKFARWAVSVLPDYFFTTSASSTGKYHPKYATGDGGLVRHTKAAVRTAITLLNLDMFSRVYTGIQRDIIITALILHDGVKKGVPEEKYTKHDHPLLVGEYLEGAFEALTPEDVAVMTTVSVRAQVYRLIQSHMGQWNTNAKSNEVLPKPKTPAEKFVHMCDYIASRKLYEVNFEAQV